MQLAHFFVNAGPSMFGFSLAQGRTRRLSRCGVGIHMCHLLRYVSYGKFVVCVEYQNRHLSSQYPQCDTAQREARAGDDYAFHQAASLSALEISARVAFSLSLTGT